jgi:MFS superfamily sulfate permease-like transporter
VTSPTGGRRTVAATLGAGWAITRGLLPQGADYAAMRRNPKRDILAGVTVAFVALPLALAFGVASGMGAAAGLVTAIVAGVVAAIFGGNVFQTLGIYDHLAHERHLFAHTAEAIAHARAHVHKTHTHAAP